MIDISIVIVSYNTKDFLKKCIQSVISNTPKDLYVEIIVVDNASNDDSVKEIKNEFPKAIVIENEKNEGFSKANNKGVEKSKGKYILFLNPDTIILEDTLKTMYEFMEDQKKTGAATCRVELLNGKIDDASHRSFPTPWNSFSHFSGLSKVFPKTKLFGGYNLGWKDLSRIHEIDALAGAFMIVRREAGDSVNWWDEDYFFYGEDIDFCYKLKQKGWKIYFVPTTKVLHYKGVAGGIKKTSQNITTANKETRIRATNARFDAMKIFYNKHYKDKYNPLLTWLILQVIYAKKQMALKKIK